MFFKRIFFLLSCIVAGLTAPAQAHIIAYQKWHNPSTGQVLEEYYDLHYPDADPAINPLQRQQFLQYAQSKKNNVLVITEDMWSFGDKALLNFNDISIENKRAVERHIHTYPSPRVLPWLYAECFVRDIPAFNAECRPDAQDLPLPQHYIDEIADYDDNPILKGFYASLEKYAQCLVDLEQEESFGFNFNHHMLAFDARILHALFTTKAPAIMLAAGALHIISINNILSQLGWIAEPLQIPTTLSAQEQKSIRAWLTHEQTDDHALILYNVFNGYDHNCTIIKDHAVDLNKISSQSLWTEISHFVRRIITVPLS